MYPPTTHLIPNVYECNLWTIRRDGSSAINVTFGRQTSAIDNLCLEADLQNEYKGTDSPLETVTVVSDSGSWTKDRNDLLRKWLPSSVKRFDTIIIDSKRCSKARTIYFFDKGTLTSAISYIAIPIDEVDEELAEAIIKLPFLHELTIRNPNLPSFVERNSAVLYRILDSFNTLEAVCISLCDADDIESILIKLQNHPNLTRLALLVSPSFHLGAIHGPAKVAFENAIIRGLESFTQLERLILTNTLVHGLLLEHLRRLPRLKDLRVMRDYTITEEKMFYDLRRV